MAPVRHVRDTHSKHVVQAIPHARFVPQTINAHTVTGTGHAQFVLNTILTTNIQGIKVTLSGNNITAQAYSDTNLTSQVGSTLSQTHPGQKSKEHGIISRASNASQGYTIDEFRVN